MSLFRKVALTEFCPSLAIGQEAAAALKAKAQTVCVFESTTAGLIQASLQAFPGASGFTTCGAVSYGKAKAYAVLGETFPTPKPTDAEEYKESKRAWTQSLARLKRKEVGSTWCVCESGACGPSFTFPEITTGFTAIFVSGPLERGIFVESSHNDREANMWGFSKLALELLAECVETHALDSAPAKEVPMELLSATEDRYGGVEVEVRAGAVALFDTELRRSLAQWRAEGKKGIWLKIPLEASATVGRAVQQGFSFHHTKEDYVMLTQWLPTSPSPLPRHGFTQIGVGGIVLNQKGEVLMVEERVSPLPQFQGSWKLPGGLGDPGEDFAETVVREVREETGVTAELLGVVSLRHSHGYRFGQGDLYVLLKLQAVSESIEVDPHELKDARWMSVEEIKGRVAAQGPWDGKVTENSWKVIQQALYGSLIKGSPMPNSRGGKASMLYTA